MTYPELLEKYPEYTEQAQERLDIKVIEGIPEPEAMAQVVSEYTHMYKLFEQGDLFI